MASSGSFVMTMVYVGCANMNTYVYVYIYIYIQNQVHSLRCNSGCLLTCEHNLGLFPPALSLFCSRTRAIPLRLSLPLPLPLPLPLSLPPSLLGVVVLKIKKM